ncbi:MAG: uroporphyrinogen-III synthase, partial [Cytophagaceae bacterium]|nr:uroporphyrinogen-III synthase [Gemmatimonadaceae bacterium]
MSQGVELPHVEPRWAHLHDVRVIVTRPAERAVPLLELLARAGAIPIHCPGASFTRPASYDEVDRHLAGIQSFDWVLWTSVHAVDAVMERAEATG